MTLNIGHKYTMKLTPKKLKQIATIIYGEEWQSRLARDVHVNPRTMRRYASGETDCQWLIAELQRLATFYGNRTLDIAEELKKW
jgi:hypothetical protein